MWAGIQYAHNALDDVVMLAENSLTDFKKHSYNTKCNFLQEEFISCKSMNMASLRILIGKKIMNSCTIENTAASELNIEHLKLIFKINGEDGLVDVFSMKNC